jgi:large subunit ribosomal protein L7/L12
MSLSNEDIVARLGNMTVMELCDLTRELEAKWGVKAVPQIAEVPTNTVPTTPAEPEQTEFEVIIESFEATAKMGAIKLVRELTGLGLKEAKDMIEAVPKTLKTDVAKAEAQDIQAKFQAIGVKVTLK